MNSEQTVIEYIGDKKNPSCANVLINGMPINGITRISFEHSAGDIPEIVMDEENKLHRKKILGECE